MPRRRWRGPPRRSARLLGYGASTATPQSTAILLAFPSEILSLIAVGRDDAPSDVHDPLDIVHMAATCKAWRAICAADTFWRGLCLAHYPRVRQILEHADPPHPRWRELYRRHWRAEKAQRSTRHCERTNLKWAHDYYVYTVELYDDGTNADGKYYMPHHQAPGAAYPPLLRISGRLEECRGNDALRLWEHGDAPSWAESIVSSHREAGGDDFRWKIWGSTGYRIANRLRATCFITRPSDHATFCLYDELIERVPSDQNPLSTLLSILDEDPSEYEDPEEVGDCFEIHFAQASLPRGGAAAYDYDRRFMKARVQLHLRLRSEGYLRERSDDAEPVANLPGVGELEVRYLHEDGDGDDFDDNEVLTYFEHFAPFWD